MLGRKEGLGRGLRWGIALEQSVGMLHMGGSREGLWRELQRGGCGAGLSPCNPGQVESFESWVRAGTPTPAEQLQVRQPLPWQDPQPSPGRTREGGGARGRVGRLGPRTLVPQRMRMLKDAQDALEREYLRGRQQLPGAAGGFDPDRYVLDPSATRSTEPPESPPGSLSPPALMAGVLQGGGRGDLPPGAAPGGAEGAAGAGGQAAAPPAAPSSAPPAAPLPPSPILTAGCPLPLPRGELGVQRFPTPLHLWGVASLSPFFCAQQSPALVESPRGTAGDSEEVAAGLPWALWHKQHQVEEDFGDLLEQ